MGWDVGGCLLLNCVLNVMCAAGCRVHSSGGFEKGPNSMVVYLSSDPVSRDLDPRGSESYFQLDAANSQHCRWERCLLNIAQRMCDESGLRLGDIPKIEVDLVVNFPGAAPQEMHTDGTMMVQASTTYLTPSAEGTHILNYGGTLV